jgi:hypothetical protein
MLAPERRGSYALDSCRIGAPQRVDVVGPGCAKNPLDAMILRVNRRAGAMDVRLRGGD